MWRQHERVRGRDEHLKRRTRTQRPSHTDDRVTTRSFEKRVGPGALRHLNSHARVRVVNLDDFVESSRARGWADDADSATGFSMDVDAGVMRERARFKLLSDPPEPVDPQIFRLEWIGDGTTLAQVAQPDNRTKWPARRTQDYWSRTPWCFRPEFPYQSRVPAQFRESRSPRFFRPLLYRLSYLGGSLILQGIPRANRLV